MVFFVGGKTFKESFFKEKEFRSESFLDFRIFIRYV